MTVDEYRRNAAECLRLAETFSDPTNRAVLMEMAHAWERLAERAARPRMADLGLETRPRTGLPGTGSEAEDE
jgi:hypothetical protein